MGRKPVVMSLRRFQEAVDKVIAGEITVYGGAAHCKLGYHTFQTRFHQYTDPARYGELKSDVYVDDLPKRKRKPKEEVVKEEPEEIKLPDLSEFI